MKKPLLDAFEAKVLAACALVLLLVFALTLAGMGRDVGGKPLVTGYTFFWLFAWPLFFFLASRTVAQERRARRLRLFGFCSAPILYAGIVFWVPFRVWDALGLEEMRFNYFGETAIFAQFLKAVLFAAITAGVLEWLDRRRRLSH